MFALVRYTVCGEGDRLVPLANCPAAENAGSAHAEVKVTGHGTTLFGMGVECRLAPSAGHTSTKNKGAANSHVTLWARDAPHAPVPVCTAELAHSNSRKLQLVRVIVSARVPLGCGCALFATVSVPTCVQLSMLRIMPVCAQTA